MKLYHFGVGAAAIAFAASFATLAAAQSGMSRPATAQEAPPTGPALPGVCVLSNEGVVYTSAVGKSVLTRLQQLGAQTDAELSAEQTSIQNDAKAVEAQRATLPADQLQQKVGAINAREQALQRKAQLRQRELQATQEKQLGQIGVQADPIVRQVFAQRSCSILLNGNALVYPAPGMDITSAVVQGLNAKIQSLTFDREHLDEQPGAGGE